jgi:DNA repair protein SbcC/Rad50
VAQRAAEGVRGYAIVTPQFKAITITDFRSLRGTVTIPLSAPVVVIHGPNGAGKTSVLSAIELALTGKLQDMRRAEPNYRSYLLHRGANAGSIALTTADVSSDGQSTVNIVVGHTGHEGRPLLDSDVGHFFSERCYLAQATLSRLLEIYQHPTKPGDDSPLTRFVKDLLGLDQLDVLIEGLQPAGDIRNTRKLVPEYRDAEEARAALRRQLAASTASLELMRREAVALQEAVDQGITSLQSVAETTLPLEDAARIRRLLATDYEEPQLVILTSIKRELASVRQRSAVLSVTPAAVDQAAAETEERAARSALAAWQETAGARLESLINELRTTFPDLPSVASTDPVVAFNTAQARTSAELERCEQLIGHDDQLTARITDLDQAIEHARARLALSGEQLTQIIGQAEALSRVLAALIPHIHTDDCPVCGRDYREVSADPLVARVSSQVARLTEQAGRLQSLERARLEATNDLTKAERDREAAVTRRLSQENRVALKARIAILTEAKQNLTGLADVVSSGVAAIRRVASTHQHLAELRNRDMLSADLRVMVNDFCARLEQPLLDPAESISSALLRLDSNVMARDAALSARQRVRREALDTYNRLSQLRERISAMEQSISTGEQEHTRLNAVFAIAERRRSAARELSRAAADARTAIVGRVFNDSLNKIWRDLFVRLAPTEPFVPAFSLPQSVGEPVSAQLETVHRQGGKGGAPGAMLSAGNLNTAALTLFLALHLSVKPKLPWLILDDPVQSMDEVHIAQFAALLRTLSKEHHRQILITVHDRPLFEYLTLELSPAFQGDQLITVELNRSIDSVSLAEPTFLSWEPDRAVAA